MLCNLVVNSNFKIKKSCLQNFIILIPCQKFFFYHLYIVPNIDWAKNFITFPQLPKIKNIFIIIMKKEKCIIVIHTHIIKLNVSYMPYNFFFINITLM